MDTLDPHTALIVLSLCIFAAVAVFVAAVHWMGPK